MVGGLQLSQYCLEESACPLHYKRAALLDLSLVRLTSVTHQTYVRCQQEQHPTQTLLSIYCIHGFDISKRKVRNLYFSNNTEFITRLIT